VVVFVAGEDKIGAQVTDEHQSAHACVRVTNAHTPFAGEAIARWCALVGDVHDVVEYAVARTVSAYRP